MDATVAIQKFNDYVKVLGIQKDSINDIINRINRAKPYLKETSDKEDIGFMESAMLKAQNTIAKAYSKLQGIKQFIDAAKEAIGLGHPLIFIATIAATVLGVVGGLVYTVGKVTDTTKRKLDLIEKKVLPPSILAQKPGFKIDLTPLRWLTYIGIGILAVKIIFRK